MAQQHTVSNFNAWMAGQCSTSESVLPGISIGAGNDILFFCEARLEMVLELLDEVPFHNFYLHAMIKGSQGRKLSKLFECDWV